jgi:site-specific DNA recombinase
MLTMLSGFAAHERELIRERSVAGTNRLVEAGAWLGGLVPYGYLKEGERGQARIVVNDERIPGFEMSEAEVVRTIYRMSTAEKKSCQKIADHLNRTGGPCGAAGNALVSEAGKRARRTASIWRPSHVRNMIVSRTYMGERLFGKRSRNRNRPVIVRVVPGIVSEQVWQSAQNVLRSNRIMCRRNTREPYLLRGLIKCGLCGLSYSGLRMPPPQRDHYYRCNGRQQARGLYGISGKKCPAKSLNGDYVERLVWADIESFLRNPGELLERLRERVSMQDSERQRRQAELDELTARMQQKTAERDRVLGLFRRGRIDETTLDQQLDLIEAEAHGLQAEIEAAARALSAGDRAAQLQSAESLLATLRNRLEGPVPNELKRRIVEILVERIQVNTVERWGVQHAELLIAYRFSEPDEAAALVLPRTLRMDNRTRPPEELNSLATIYCAGALRSSCCNDRSRNSSASTRRAFTTGR